MRACSTSWQATSRSGARFRSGRGAGIPSLSAAERKSGERALDEQALPEFLALLKMRAPDFRMTLHKVASVENDATTVLLWEASVTPMARPMAEYLVERAASAVVSFLDDVQAGRLSGHAEAPLSGSLPGTAWLTSRSATTSRCRVNRASR